MITPRTAILTSLAVVLFSVTWTVISMLGPPDSAGMADDSFGTRSRGQRGLYETLAELGVPVSRSVMPPNQALDTQTTLVLWDPQTNLVSFEPRFLLDLGQWVAGGGRVVVSPPSDSGIESIVAASSEFPIKDATTTLWDSLGVADFGLTTDDIVLPVMDTDEESTPDASSDDAEADNGPPRPIVIEVRSEGSLSQLTEGVQRLATLDDSLQTIAVGENEPAGRVTCRDDDGDPHDLVVSMAVGKGEVIVVSDPQLFSNRLLAQADNSVLAVRLLLGDRTGVQFNEFYHGLSVRGNPLWLFTRRGYALIATVIVAVVAVVTWRSAVLLGPPLTTPEPSRRTVAEYIDAMSQFLNRGRQTRPQLLQAVAAGTVRRIGTEFGMAHGRDNPQAVAAVVAHRDPDRADRLRQATAAVDAVLAKHDKANEKETVLALRQLQECL